MAAGAGDGVVAAEATGCPVLALALVSVAVVVAGVGDEMAAAVECFAVVAAVWTAASLEACFLDWPGEGLPSDPFEVVFADVLMSTTAWAAWSSVADEPSPWSDLAPAPAGSAAQAIASVATSVAQIGARAAK